MKWLRRFFAWLFGPSLDKLLGHAESAGVVTLSVVEGHGWQCAVRVRGARRTVWVGEGFSPREAVLDVLNDIAEHDGVLVQGAPCAPKLGGKEFDD